MNRKITLLLTLVFLTCAARGQNTVLTTEQTASVLEFYFADQLPDYPLQGIRIYPNGRHFTLRLDVQLDRADETPALINILDALDNVCQYTRDTISVYTVIVHWQDRATPTIFEADAACTASFFRDKKLSQSDWFGACLIRRESLAPFSLTPNEKP